MKVSTAESATNFKGTVRIMRFGYNDRADNISKSLIDISKFLEHKNYDLFVKNGRENIKVFAQKPEDYVLGKKAKSVKILEKNAEPKNILVAASDALSDYIVNSGISSKKNISMQGTKNKSGSVFGSIKSSVNNILNFFKSKKS